MRPELSSLRCATETKWGCNNKSRVGTSVFHRRRTIFANQTCLNGNHRPSLSEGRRWLWSIEGKDVFDLLREEENKYRRDHEDHDRLKQDEAEVMFATFDYGVSVNLHKNLTYKSKLWRVKSVKTKSHCLFLHGNQFYESKGDGCVLFGDPKVNEASFIAFEVENKHVEADSYNLTYKNNETVKLHSMFDRRKREGDRHKTKEDRHKNTKKRRQASWSLTRPASWSLTRQAYW